MNEASLHENLPGFDEPLAASSLSQLDLDDIGESMAKWRGVKFPGL